MARRLHGGAIVRALDALGAITGNVGIPFPDTPGAFTFTSASNWPFGTVLGTGPGSSGVLNNNQTFVYYNIRDTQEARSLLFAGDPTTSFPTTGITGYDLTDEAIAAAFSAITPL